MTQDEQDTLVQLEQDEERSRRHRRIGVWVLVAVLIVLSGVLAYVLIVGGQQQDQIDALTEQASDSDEAAVEVASQRQAQARTVLELCESGAIEQDDAGKAACAEAEQAAEQDPAQTVAEAKAGPQGPPGPPGRPGSDGADGSDGEAGDAGAPGADGSDGAPGADGSDGDAGAKGEAGADGSPGEPGADGARGEDGSDGAKGDPGSAGADGEPGATGAKGEPGPAGPQGSTGERGPQGEPGPAGPAGEDGEDGRGIESATCSSDTGRWTVKYTDGESTDAGPCIAATPDEPAPTPTPTEEVTE